MSDYYVSNNLYICQRILARFSPDFGFILLSTSLEVHWSVVFFRATSLLSALAHRMLRARPCAFMDSVCIYE